MICLILTHSVIRIYQNISEVLLTSAFILWPSCTCGFGIRKKNPMRFAVFWRISVRFSDSEHCLDEPRNCQMISVKEIWHPAGRITEYFNLNQGLRY